VETISETTPEPFDPLAFEMQQLEIIIGNVEFAADYENQSTLDSDDCESIARLLKELYELRYRCQP
jgi:hypothetical protein